MEIFSKRTSLENLDREIFPSPQTWRQVSAHGYSRSNFLVQPVPLPPYNIAPPLCLLINKIFQSLHTCSYGCSLFGTNSSQHCDKYLTHPQIHHLLTFLHSSFTPN